jgi:hypothetical protein
MRLRAIWAAVAVVAACGGSSLSNGGAGGGGSGGNSPHGGGVAGSDVPASAGGAGGEGGSSGKPMTVGAGEAGELAGGEPGSIVIAMCEPDVDASNGGAGGDSGAPGDPGACSYCFNGVCQPLRSGAGGAGECACPPYAPDLCASSNICTRLTEDPAHCGACASHCGATEACSAGKCVPAPRLLAQLPGCGFVRLLLQSGILYALDEAAGALEKIALPGGERTSIAKGLRAPSAFALDSANAYVVTGTSITRVSLLSRATSVVVNEAADIYDVSEHDGKLYYGVRRPGKTPGGDVKSVAASARNGVGISVAMPSDLGVPKGVATSAGYVFYVSDDAFDVEGDSLVGAGHVKLGASQAGLVFGHRSVQTDGQNVLWINSNVQRRSPSANAPADSVWIDRVGLGATAFAFNATTIYAASSAGDLEKTPFGVEPAQWLGRNLGHVDSIVLDDTNVYFSAAPGKIMTTPL